MESEQFSLCWNNFHTNLSSGFNSLLKDEDLVDVTLAAEGRFLKAHKTVLSVCSPFFKDLFRANPSKHPIVILPEVNYGALCSLLQFMYQGEVSVSQEEIPTFMRVAEMLKVKGLTDNNASPSSSVMNNDSNGFSGYNKSPYNLSMNSRENSRRPRPVKKIIKPIQHLRPIESLRTVKSPHPPPAKKHHSEETQSGEKHFPEPLIKPKEEPIDPKEDNSRQSFDENNLEMSSLLDVSVGESSNSNWPSASDVGKGYDSSQPGTLQCIVGKRGNPRLIVDGHAFFKKSVYKGKAFWYCKSSRTPERCPAVCWTLHGNIVKWPYLHSHPVVPDSFNPEEDTEVPSENIQQVLWQATRGGGLMLLKSGRGQLVLIHNGHIFTHSEKKNNCHIWVCVKKKTLNCEGAITTLNGPVLLTSSAHNHPQLQDVIQRLQVPSCSISPELL